MREKVILLIEDNPDDVALTRRAFEKNRMTHQLIIAPDGAEALNFLFCTGAHTDRDPSINPALILLDLKLPKRDGLDVLAHIRADERTRLLLVVILTSSVEQEDMVKGYRLGANSYIRKPIDFDEFVAVINQLGAYWLVLNQHPGSRL